jgi:hypothetical protein
MHLSLTTIVCGKHCMLMLHTQPHMCATKGIVLVRLERCSGYEPNRRIFRGTTPFQMGACVSMWLDRLFYHGAIPLPRCLATPEQSP